MLDNEYEFHPMMEETRIKESLEKAKRQRDRSKVEEETKKLVNLYVSQGEYFKMGDRPDPNMAKRYLIKALSLQKDHPVANYRLGFLYYREKQFTKAVSYFEKALDGSRDEDVEELNDTQRMLSNMFLVNCGIKIAKEAIREIDFIEENLYSDLEIDRIERYRNEILVLEEDIFDKMFYRKIEDGVEEKIGEYEFNHFIPAKKQVLLKSSDQGLQIVLQHERPVSLNPKAFYVLYGILTGKGFKTYNELKEIAGEGSGQEITDDYLRQIIRRLSRDLPYWDRIVETSMILNPDTRRNVAGIKLAEGYSACILCRVEDRLP
ncbi:tetratricopeptide repeat protein [Neobacillus sp. Marseille-QA0830]